MTILRDNLANRLTMLFERLRRYGVIAQQRLGTDRGIAQSHDDLLAEFVRRKSRTRRSLHGWCFYTRTAFADWKDGGWLMIQCGGMTFAAQREVVQLVLDAALLGGLFRAERSAGGMQVRVAMPAAHREIVLRRAQLGPDVRALAMGVLG